MHALWIYLKENTKCGSKLTDVVCSQEDQIKCKSRWSVKKPESKLGHPVQNIVRPQIFGQNYIRMRYIELEIGDPSRNIVEKIIRAASAEPSKHFSKIRKVLKVINPIDILEKFERYRETVKKSSFEQYKKHPRTIIDGNEMLQFYGTTMTCCTGKTKVSELCKDPCCRVCRIIQSGFNTAYNKASGIRLNTSSEELSEDITVISRGKDVKRAVIVCRAIAGRVVNLDGDASEQDCDSLGDGVHSRIEYLNLRNPSSVLACFIMVFS
ncbi:hypothetical protein ACH5RR_027807 [Cinchona calisaya]|uniref:Nucleic acid binding protein n=1 Tax=Cinchona calisaya TaxID=153742 RepID=A0ABD2YP27_9GENT